ncbi:MAG: TIGR01777 family oxidoreductase [Planctomycetota bacterium]
MRILVSGATGQIGSALVPSLEGDGHEVVPLLRSAGESPGPEAAGKPWWNPAAGAIARDALEGFDAVVHLAGENVRSFGRWSRAKKERIRSSRVTGTRLLCDTLARLERPPRVLAGASAVAFYGSRGDEILTEESPPGEGFLAEVCRAWEAASSPARDAGIRTVLLRLGIVLTPAGGAFRNMLLPFRLGMGGHLGNGRQYLGWITMEDLGAVIRFALEHEEISGSLNAVAGAVTNAEFTRALAAALRRPAVLAFPAFLLRATLGEMARELLLSSARVEPRRLLDAGFSFGSPDLASALRRMLAGTAAEAARTEPRSDPGP